MELPEKIYACINCKNTKRKCEGVKVNFDDNEYEPKLTYCKMCLEKKVECIITTPHCVLCKKKFGKNETIGLCLGCKMSRMLEISISRHEQTILAFENIISRLEQTTPISESIHSAILILRDEKSVTEQVIRKLRQQLINQLTRGD
ncbi:1968_t:CDS:1 [Dentiscutata erythropus]|uniref:1968_t:CDS:1 n=1 Tax=Dentiscutata erythropus TaxID=1348616 RepID=A0A9N9NS20_9GLOM|nr:1968_t:CDS:1 [Dentiscutata erythropus]